MPRQRILDANQLFIGSEPKVTGKMTKIDMIKSMNWYSQNKQEKDAFKYAHDFMKKHHKIDVEEFLKDKTPTFGFVCRMITNGCSLDEKSQKWFDTQIIQLKKSIELKKKRKVKVEQKQTISIQDRINEKVNEIAGELEGSLDDYILGKFKVIPSPASILQDKVKGVHANRIIEIFKKKRIEFDNVLHTSDEQIKEGYSNFSKMQLKKIIAYCDLIITDAGGVVKQAVKTRKPRKRKAKPVSVVVSKVKYLQEDTSLKLKSVQPSEIIGAMQLWVFNVKTRKLGCYHAEDASGLNIKGTSLLNFNQSKSVHKKVRKPDVMVPEIVKGGKVFLRNVINNIKAVEGEMSGRINEDTLLLRVIK